MPLPSAGGGFAQLSVTRDIAEQREVDAAVAADLIERTQAQEALRASEKQLREADRRKDELIAVLAHELRNPLVPGAEVCIVAVTGWGQEQDRQLAAEAGFDRHMTKLADPEQLVELLGARARMI